MFQFQDGAIIRSAADWTTFNNKVFQFQDGAIISKGQSIFNRQLRVSIPRWCDYKHKQPDYWEQV